MVFKLTADGLNFGIGSVRLEETAEIQATMRTKVFISTIKLKNLFAERINTKRFTDFYEVPQ